MTEQRESSQNTSVEYALVTKCDRESYTIARDILQLILEETLYQTGKKDEAFEEMLKQKDTLAQKKGRLDKEIKQIRHRAAMAIVRDEMLDKVIAEIALETVKENLYLSKKINDKMLDILVRALKLERGSSTNADDLQVLAQNLEDKKLVAAREAIMNLFEKKDLDVKVKLANLRNKMPIGLSSRNGGKSIPICRTNIWKLRRNLTRSVL